MAETPNYDPAPHFQMSQQQWALISTGQTRALSLVIHALAKSLGPDRQNEIAGLEKRMLEDARNMPIRGVPMNDEKLVVDMITASVVMAFQIVRAESE